MQSEAETQTHRQCASLLANVSVRLVYKQIKLNQYYSATFSLVLRYLPDFLVEVLATGE